MLEVETYSQCDTTVVEQHELKLCNDSVNAVKSKASLYNLRQLLPKFSWNDALSFHRYIRFELVSEMRNHLITGPTLLQWFSRARYNFNSDIR